jgi:hypothetical protein
MILNFFKKINRAFELRGMYRAAIELDRLGYKKESQYLMDRIKKYKLI